MKQLLGFTFSVCLLLACFAFTPEVYSDTYKEKGVMNATVNSHTFELRQKDFYRALLVKKSNPLAFSPEAKNRTVASITFFGNDTSSADHSPFSENISIEYTFNPALKGEAADASFELHYDLADYYILPDENHFSVSRMSWGADKSYFLLDGEFECKLRKQGFPAELQPVVTLKGNLRDVNVSVPPWIASKIAVDATGSN